MYNCQTEQKDRAHVPMLYVVRCRFVGSETEEEGWNAWYSGPKLADMLLMPHFRAGHRFRSDEERPTYLALWVVDGPEAFETERYRAGWGFSEWTEHVTDWSRDLVDPARGRLDALDLGSPVTVSATDDAAADPGDGVWCRNVGLDRTWEWLALGSPATAPAHPLWTATFHPLDDLLDGPPGDPVNDDEGRPA
jgi:hypothetical protein